MPSNLLPIDTNFPTFTGEETEEEQIQQLVNYLYQLRESLQYSLQNLSKENFNAAALDNLTKEASQAVAEELQKVMNALSQLNAEISGMQGKLGGMETSIEELKGYAILEIEIVEVI